MSCGFSREMSKRSLTISSWTRTRAKPVSRSIFSSPPVQSRSYLRRETSNAQLQMRFQRARSGYQGEYTVTYLVRWHLE